MVACHRRAEGQYDEGIRLTKEDTGKKRLIMKKKDLSNSR